LPRRSLPLLVLLALVTAACRGDSDSGEAPVASVDPEAVTLGATLWQARGHQLVALDLLAAGDEAAAIHAAHPIEEVLASVEGEVEEHGGDPASLRAAFEAFLDAVETGGDAEAAAEQSRTAIEEAEAAVAGDPEDPAYRGSVVAALLSTAAHEYEESLGNGQVTETVEYQDGYGFVRAAQELYEDIAPAVEEASAEEAEEIEEAFSTLEAAFPDPQPPSSPATVEDVERAAGLVGHELEETVGAQPVESADPEEVFDRIETLLGQILAEYEEGEAEEAAELAAEAYLENYEVVEADVIRLAPEVNEELEPLLGAELRARIQEGVSAEELERMIDRARELLAQAREAVLEES
jgi:hypothetical protein